MKRSNRCNQIVYAMWSPFYDLLVSVPFLRRARAQTLAAIDLQAGDRVLLIGVGTGADLPLLPAGIDAVGIDNSQAMLNRARRKLAQCKCPIEMIRADAEQLPFPDESFDAVVMTLILSVVADGQRALAEAMRVLRFDGRAVVFDKFLPEGGRASIGRRVLNMLTSTFGTDINRRFGDLRGDTQCIIERDDPVVFGSAYRVVLLRKKPLE